MEHIHDKFPENNTVLLLGRYGFDGKNLNKLNKLFIYTADNRVISKKYPKRKIRYRTAHSSKGLGADNVIVINGKDDILGFPSKIEDDPVRKLVLKDTKEIDFAEERRLFYVALTRTKNRVYLIAPKSKPSQFIIERTKNFTNIVLSGPRLEDNSEADFHYRCPRCGYPLQVRRKRGKALGKELTLYICSNDPEFCGFATNDISGGNLAIQKCPSCEDGYLIVKRVKGKEEGKNSYILGCSNYKSDKTGCNYIINPENYSTSWEETSLKKANFYQNKKKLPIQACVLAGYPILDLLKIIKYVTGKLSESTKFGFNRYSLKSFLIGKEENSLVLYGLTKDKAYGQINPKYSRLLFR